MLQCQEGSDVNSSTWSRIKYELINSISDMVSGLTTQLVDTLE